jgi:hypothetical protein
VAELSVGLVLLMVAGVLFVLMGALLLLLVLVNGRATGPSRAARNRAGERADRAQARAGRARARAGRRTRRGAPWSSTGMNALLLLLLMAPYADRLTMAV